MSSATTHLGCFFGDLLVGVAVSLAASFVLSSLDHAVEAELVEDTPFHEGFAIK